MAIWTLFSLSYFKIIMYLFLLAHITSPGAQWWRYTLHEYLEIIIILSQWQRDGGWLDAFWLPVKFPFLLQPFQQLPLFFWGIFVLSGEAVSAHHCYRGGTDDVELVKQYIYLISLATVIDSGVDIGLNSIKLGWISKLLLRAVGHGHIVVIQMMLGYKCEAED